MLNILNIGYITNTDEGVCMCGYMVSTPNCRHTHTHSDPLYSSSLGRFRDRIINPHGTAQINIHTHTSSIIQLITIICSQKAMTSPC